MSNRDGDVLRCSFCGKSQHEVRKLIAGPTVYICNECVEVCLDIIAEDRVHEAKARQQVLAKPPEIKAFIDEYVIGQEMAKKKLAVAVYNHYRRIEYQRGRGSSGSRRTWGKGGADRPGRLRQRRQFKLIQPGLGRYQVPGEPRVPAGQQVV